MKPIVWRFGLMAFLVLALFQLSKFSLMTHAMPAEWLLILLAVAFGLMGSWLNKKMNAKPDVAGKAPESIQLIKPEEKLQDAALVQKVLQQTGISARELEVLKAMAAGLSNQEIAATLYISETTVKTHVSNLLLKLDAKRRTQAVDFARKKGLIE